LAGERLEEDSALDLSRVIQSLFQQGATAGDGAGAQIQTSNAKLEHLLGDAVTTSKVCIAATKISIQTSGKGKRHICS
jgi:hypothetical protein